MNKAFKRGILRCLVTIYKACPARKFILYAILRFCPALIDSTNLGFARGMLIELIKSRPRVGVEIGVNRGLNASIMLELLPLSRLYLVDPYVFYEDVDEVWDWDTNKKYARERLKSLDDIVRFIFKFPSQAAEEIPDNLDFVYMDANHSYEYVKQDIKDYYPKVRQGGLLGGHDYSRPGVNKAVNELGLTVNQGVGNDWWIIK